jgi:hypothetical protein
MPLIFLFFVLALAAYAYVRVQPKAHRRAALIRVLVASAIAGVVILALTGRTHLIFALLAVLYPLLRRFLPGWALRRVLRGGIPGGMGGWGGLGGAKPSAQQQSTIRTTWLEMTLDHDSGALAGTVLQGRWSGRALSDLTETECLALFQDCQQHDHDSARVLESYLDQRLGDQWRTQQAEADPEQPRASGSEPLTRTEALAILGVNEPFEKQDVVKAHRRLMQRLHPDRGGSDWLAARINEAKKILLS